VTLLVSAFTGGAHAQTYAALPIDPGRFAGFTMSSHGINASGAVVGTATAPMSDFPSASASFIADPKTRTMTDVGPETCVPTSDFSTCLSTANAINDAGQVAGAAFFVDEPAGFYLTGAFVTDESSQNYTFLVGTATDSWYYYNAAGRVTGTAWAINGTGRAAGDACLASCSTHHAFITDAGTGAPVDLGTLGGANSRAYGVNAAGRVAGEADTAAGVTHAFLTDAVSNALIDLGTLGGAGSHARAINVAGQVSGEADTPAGATHAFVTSAVAGALTDLGTLGGKNSYGYAINTSGEVTGASDVAGGGATHGFLWSQGRLRDLNDLVPASQSAMFEIISGTGINDAGEISADVYNKVSHESAVMVLLPVAAPVPGPPPGAASGGGGGVSDERMIVLICLLVVFRARDPRRRRENPKIVVH
jgi:probable HAF family extracellular repeat protein